MLPGSGSWIGLPNVQFLVHYACPISENIPGLACACSSSQGWGVCFAGAGRFSIPVLPFAAPCVVVGLRGRVAHRMCIKAYVFDGPRGSCMRPFFPLALTGALARIYMADLYILIFMRVLAVLRTGAVHCAVQAGE